MSVFNDEAYVRDSLESILNQSYSNFEFIIINDGSSDNTQKILEEYSDPRIILIKNDLNIGLTRSLNIGIQKSEGIYIARQDADDISFPERISKQVLFLEENPAVGLVGTGVNYLDVVSGINEQWIPICDPVEIQRTSLYSVPFRHGTFMFRRTCIDDINQAYDEKFIVAQDCDLLLRIGERWELANIPEVLYLNRIHPKRVTSSRNKEQEFSLAVARGLAMQRRKKFGWKRILKITSKNPEWVNRADRSWLGKRYVYWAESAREINKFRALEFLLIAICLEPTSTEVRKFISGFIRRKIRGLQMIGSSG